MRCGGHGKAAAVELKAAPAVWMIASLRGAPPRMTPSFHTLVESSPPSRRSTRSTPEILECHLVAGGFDYLLTTWPNMPACREFAGGAICTLPGVRETRTYAVMEEVKNTTTLAF
jgi:DNA-binding Lrp family transcriptional regulator